MRSQPVLLSETPRAGIYGHRFILPSGLKMKPARVEEFLRRAAANDIGRDYLAVNRQVKQQLANGALRTGKETIVLANINVGALPPKRQDAILEFLHKRLSDLDGLIAEIDWPAEGKSTAVHRDELNNWLASEEMRGLPPSQLLALTPLHAVLAGILLGLLAGLFIIHLL